MPGWHGMRTTARANRNCAQEAIVARLLTDVRDDLEPAAPGQHPPLRH